MSDAFQSGETLSEQLERKLGLPPGTGLVEEMRMHLNRLLESEDPGWIDLVVWRLTEEGIPLPEGIQRLAAQAAIRRLLGEGKRGANPTAVMREFSRDVVHANAAFLKGVQGDTSWKAYVNATNAVGAETGHADKASSLSNQRSAYAAKGPIAGMLIEIGAIWAQSHPEQRAALEDYLENIPKRDPGTPRGEHYPAK